MIRALFTLMLWPTVAWAAEQQSWLTLGLHAANLALLVFVIVKFAKGPTREALQSRALKIRQRMAEADALHLRATEELARYKARVENLDAEIEAFLETERAEIKAEAEALMAEAEADARRIREDARRVATSDLDHLRHELRVELVDKAMALAKELLRERLTNNDHERLTADYLQALEAISRSEDAQ